MTLKFIINTDYKPQSQPLVSPPSPNYTPGIIPTPTPRAIPSQPHSGVENSQIHMHETASHQAFQSAEELGGKLAAFHQFVEHVNNPMIENAHYAHALKKHAGARAFEQICSDLSLAVTGKSDAAAGEKLLTQNFRILLRLRNAEGKNPLDQILDHFRNQLDRYRAIGEINNLIATLLSYQDSLKSSPTSYPGRHFNAPLLKDKATREFKQLSPKAMGLLCLKLWELGGRPSVNNYGYDTAVHDIQKLLNYSDSCPITDCLVRLESENKARLSYTTARVCCEEVLPSDTPTIAQDVLTGYQLEDLKLLLNDPTKNNEFLVSKYRKLNPELREMLNKLVGIAMNKPHESGFGERFLTKNMRSLLKIQNDEHIDIISQLIPHYSEKVKAGRLAKEVENYIIAVGRNPNSPKTALEHFNNLSAKAQEDLRFRVWFEHGGKNNPHFGGYDYGGKTIASKPYVLSLGTPSIVMSYMAELKLKTDQGDRILTLALERFKTVPGQPIDVTSRPLEEEPGLVKELPRHVRVAHVTAEFAGIASLGGLASAVDGIVRGFGANDSRVIIPLYRNGPIADTLIKTMKETDHEIWAEGRRIKILKAKVNGVRCYFVDDPGELFKIPKKEDNTSGNFYEGDYHHIRRRWAVFQKAAADLCYDFSKKENPVELVHVHDAQTALVPRFLKEHHREEYARGETPATVFTFHNNREPMEYNGEQAVSILERLGLPKKEVNSFVKALHSTDMVTTVSETFGKEAQMKNLDFGNGMDDFIREIAYEGKLVGIVNGNSNGWNPAKDDQLENWVSVLPATLGQKAKLRFGVDSDPQTLADKMVLIQRELCTYLKELGPEHEAYTDLDPEKPIVMYLGRYDSAQKGIEKLPLIMEETLKNGGQFVCVGLEPDKEAKHVLDAMKKTAEELGNKGVLILVDRKKDGKRIHQDVFGNILRAACSLPVFPSRYEPCGLVQGEFNRYGKKVVATMTGGFVDTLKTEGPDASGYLFNRMPDWFSQEQDDEIRKTLALALEEAKERQRALYHGDLSEITPHMEHMRAVMKNALASTWETTPDGSSSAIRRLELVYSKAFQRRREKRGITNANLQTVKV